MKNKEKEIEDKFKELDERIGRLPKSINVLEFTKDQISNSSYQGEKGKEQFEEKIRLITNSSRELIFEFENLISEMKEIKENLMITQEELKIIREKSHPINIIYMKLPLSIRILALIISPLSIIQIWKILCCRCSYSNSKLDKRYKEENLFRRDWE